MILKICIIIFLLVIVYQDFKYLAISWWAITVLFLLAAYQAAQYLDLKLLLTAFLINMAVLSFQLAVLTLYFSVKNKKLTNIVNKYLGIGDILFFVFLAISFEPVHFILFLTLSLFAVLVLFVLLKITKALKNEYLPLAGGISIIYIIISVLSILFKYNMYSSDTLYSFFI